MLAFILAFFLIAWWFGLVPIALSASLFNFLAVLLIAIIFVQAVEGGRA